MDNEQIRTWLGVRGVLFVDQVYLKKSDESYQFTIRELANYLRAIADEAELREDNPNFPESK